MRHCGTGKAKKGQPLQLKKARSFGQKISEWFTEVAIEVAQTTEVRVRVIDGKDRSFGGRSLESLRNASARVRNVRFVMVLGIWAPRRDQGKPQPATVGNVCKSPWSLVVVTEAGWDEANGVYRATGGQRWGFRSWVETICHESIVITIPDLSTPGTSHVLRSAATRHEARSTDVVPKAHRLKMENGHWSGTAPVMIGVERRTKRNSSSSKKNMFSIFRDLRIHEQKRYLSLQSRSVMSAQDWQERTGGVYAWFENRSDL